MVDGAVMADTPDFHTYISTKQGETWCTRCEWGTYVPADGAAERIAAAQQAHNKSAHTPGAHDG